eukprot:1160303-Pelagomonas_calceolata.AAC.6
MGESLRWPVATSTIEWSYTQGPGHRLLPSPTRDKTHRIPVLQCCSPAAPAVPPPLLAVQLLLPCPPAALHAPAAAAAAAAAGHLYVRHCCWVLGGAGVGGAVPLRAAAGPA